MQRSRKITFVILAAALFALAACYFFLPFGPFPIPPSPNCGPEHWRGLGVQFESKSDVVAYLQAHELELLSGSNIPRLSEFPPDMRGVRMDVNIDWQSIEGEIQVEHRLGYKVYTLVFHHPACDKNQTYTFKVTSYGFASLYGCCGI